MHENRLPDASVSAAIVSQDIKSLASVGAGGLEFVPYYLYGLPSDDDKRPTDWNKYGFGTPAFNDIFKAALRVADEEGLTVDFAVGANQGQGVPSEPLTPGLAVHLVSGGYHLTYFVRFATRESAISDYLYRQWATPTSMVESQ